MAKRMMVPVNFLNKDDYDYVVSQPNRCHYMRELVRKDRLNQQNDRDYIDKRIEELEKKLNSLPYTDKEQIKDSEELKKSLKSIINMYD